MNEEMKSEAAAEPVAMPHVHDVPVDVIKAEAPFAASQDPNAALKSLLELTFDSVDLVQAILAKKNFIAMIPKAYELVSDFPKAVEAWPSLKQEIINLPGSPAEADLLAFVQTKVAGMGAPEKAQKILAASLKLIHDLSLDVNDLIVAIKS